MPRQPSKHRSFWTPFLFFLLLIIGVFIGFQLHKYIGTKRPITTVIERNDRLEELINLVSDRYVDSISTDSLYQDAIFGILKHLDPHTTYIPAGEAAQVQAGLKGAFKGIGIEVYNIQDTMMVSKVSANSPAQEAGIRFGDRLIAIDSTQVANRNLTVEDIKNMFFLGGNQVRKVMVIHAGGSEPEQLTLKRGIVPLYSVPASYMVDSITGYIKIGRFSANTYREFKRALKSLQQEGMKQLLLDLRGNPGGYVDAATAVADEFLEGHRMLVYTKGRATEREDFYSDNKGLFEEGRLAVLVDLQTASAAEILAGAIQDWDRGVLLGSRTFGKGLVQQQYELGDGALLRLTIARYFTPSGRCIQRPYSRGKEAYNESFLNRLYHPGMIIDTQVVDTIGKKEKYYSMISHRTLWGGGGILPDIVISKEPPYSEKAMLEVTASRWMNEFVFDFYIRNYPTISQFETSEELANDFKIPDVLLDRLKMRLDMVYPRVVYELWQNPFAIDYIRLQLKAQLIQLIFGEVDYYRFLNQQDIDVLRAENVLNHPVIYSKIIGGKTA